MDRKMDGKHINKPNIVFILTDDQGYWSLGCYGNKEIHQIWTDWQNGESGLIIFSVFLQYVLRLERL